MKQLVSLMGILNCTPDSFYGGSAPPLAPPVLLGPWALSQGLAPQGSRASLLPLAPLDPVALPTGLRVTGGNYDGVSALYSRARQMEAEGATWIDVGGESTRPGATAVSEEEELKRVLTVIEKIRQHSSISISIDTQKSQVARQAIQAGANMVNDVSGLTRDPKMVQVVAEAGCQVVIMHSRGNPQTMNHLTQYTNCIREVLKELEQRVEKAIASGIKEKQIWIDPGFGFAKNTEQNWELLKNLKEFKSMGFPLLVALSRKNFLAPVKNPEDRLSETLAANLEAVKNGADILRVHDVKEHRSLLSEWGKYQ